ncbi:MAG: hypothetical protein JST12_07760 [Armatimonadetes bacterium]|nr:hypothetical protein [Armatimonadota bacterium]MBS1701540.1 hypothetical protein [Armatimonadota bacterium]MBS1725717.1 hypothetical protein [Armatimonadota bacterium]
MKQAMSIAFPTRSMAALLAIAIIDLIMTAVLHSKGMIVELNPLMRGFITQSEWLFAFVKGLTIGVAWGTMAWYAQQNKEFVGRACTIGALSYVTVWTTWFITGR